MSRNFVQSAALFGALALVLSGCTSGAASLTDAQQAMVEAGPYDAAASDLALQACSDISGARTKLISQELVLETVAGYSEFEYIVLQALVKAFDASQITTRYEEIYASIYGLDNALIYDDPEGIYFMLDDVLEQCSNMTVVDNESLAERGIKITPGNIPNIPDAAPVNEEAGASLDAPADSTTSVVE